MVEIVVITGCSGSGKSSLLAELARRGHRVLPEAGRQIVQEQMAAGGDGVPWENRAKFATLAADRAAHHYDALRDGQVDDGHEGGRLVFADRSVVDVVTFFARCGMEIPARLKALLTRYRYHPTVLMSPPWEEIFQTDAERRHGFAESVAEYEWLLGAYAAQGYEWIEIPKRPVPERAAFVANHPRLKR